MIRVRMLIKGTVQGVGFRPHVYRLAETFRVRGFVLNSEDGLLIEVEGEDDKVRSFMQALENNPPPLSKIKEIRREMLSPKGYAEFVILESGKGKERDVMIPQDVAMCEKCKNEVLDPSDRHYLYPFTNCTNCGPRFTIIKDVPYDRKNTTMHIFQMCNSCRKEYENPLDRRFHAQPTACPFCGPKVLIYDAEKRHVEGDWLIIAWQILSEGRILAVKGIGGFHIACDAKNSSSVLLLRQRKGRDSKPFALMMRDLDTVRKYCVVNEIEKMLLTSKEAPIVVLERKNNLLPSGIAPGLKTLGVMLPYSPLHFLLLSGPLDVLVMTSGNHSDLPIVKDNEEAFERLKDIADFFLIHEREIENRCDDSLLQVVGRDIQIMRRSRGFVPEALKVKRCGNFHILGIGGEMKNNFCIVKKDQAFLSQYMGDVDSLEGEKNLREAIRTFEKLLGIKIEMVSFDAHPDYISSWIAKNIDAQIHIPVYHHHAHLASVMAEHNLEETAIGVILDGTGYGRDGNLWGFEVLTGGYSDFKREFHLAYVPLPGGERAIKEPWRVAISYLLTFLGDRGRCYAERLFGEQKVEIIEKIIEKGFNSPLSSGCGRIFDAVSAMLHICLVNTYEGQAAIELSELARGGNIQDFYRYEIIDSVILPSRIFEGILKDVFSNIPKDLISVKFHNTIIMIIKEAVQKIREREGLKTVVLSGGSWQNPYLFKRTKEVLNSLGFSVFSHSSIPTNDGGICLGQAMIADRVASCA